MHPPTVNLFYAIVESPCGADHGPRRQPRAAGRPVAASRAAVEEDQLQPPALAEERRQPGRVARVHRPRARFQQEPAAVGMTGVVKDGDLVAVPGEDVEDLVEGRVGEQFEPAEAITLGILEDVLKPSEFLWQVPQITPFLLLVGEGQDDDRQLHHFLDPRGIRTRSDRGDLTNGDSAMDRAGGDALDWLQNRMKPFTARRFFCRVALSESLPHPWTNKRRGGVDTPSPWVMSGVSVGGMARFRPLHYRAGDQLRSVERSLFNDLHILLDLGELLLDLGFLFHELCTLRKY